MYLFNSNSSAVSIQYNSQLLISDIASYELLEIHAPNPIPDLYVNLYIATQLSD